MDTLLEATLPLSKPHLRHILVGLRKPPKTVLLYGPPGTGKTSLAHALCDSLDLPLLQLMPSSVLSKWSGEAVRAVKAAFDEASRRDPVVLFVDEIDAFGQSRGTEDACQRQLLTEILMQISKFCDNDDRSVLLAATNRPEDLDAALVRRFDRIVELPLPNPEARGEILNRCLSQVDNALTQSDVERLVVYTEGASGADLQLLVRRACMKGVAKLVRSGATSASLEPVSIFDFPFD